MTSIQCINNCCLETLSILPDKCVDLFICDLPYGCLDGGGGKEKTYRSEKYDTGIVVKGGCPWDIKIDLEKLWIQIKRLCKNDNTPVLMFCNTKFGFELYNSNPDWFRYDIVWNKNCGTNFLRANKQPMTSHEMIYVFSKKQAFYNRIDHAVEGKGKCGGGTGARAGLCFGDELVRKNNNRDDNMRCPLSVIDFPRNISKLHPTCKSVELYKWFIERYSNEGDTVVDPTAGSFNSGRACKELNRNYIGIELDEKFYNANKLD
jgi:site-specific DNA-methyltransferase (adenine-specific)